MERIFGLENLGVRKFSTTDCKFFITTDDGIIKRSAEIQEIRIINPIDFVREVFNED